VIIKRPSIMFWSEEARKAMEPALSRSLWNAIFREARRQLSRIGA
jgi:hypothetical protein